MPLNKQEYKARYAYRKGLAELSQSVGVSLLLHLVPESEIKLPLKYCLPRLEDYSEFVLILHLKVVLLPNFHLLLELVISPPGKEWQPNGRFH